MKRILKYIMFVIVIISIFLFWVNFSLATSLSGLDAEGSHEFDNFGNAIIKVLTTIGMVVSVIALIAIGIKYMMGSMEQRAEYKKTLMPYIIGAILVFAASSIASIIYNVAKGI